MPYALYLNCDLYALYGLVSRSRYKYPRTAQAFSFASISVSFSELDQPNLQAETLR